MLTTNHIRIFKVIEKIKKKNGRCQPAHLIMHCKLTYQEAKNHISYYELLNDPEEEILHIVNYQDVRS